MLDMDLSSDSGRSAGLSTRVNQVDTLKALAIFLVLVDHSLSDRVVNSVWGILHVSQSVPIFMVLIGYAGQWGGVRRRLVRLLVPFVILWLASFALALVHGVQPVGWITLSGYLPFSGPGNFFVPLVLCICLLLPLFRRLAKKSMLLLVLVAGAADLAFELAAPHIPPLSGDYPFLYSEAFPRYLLLVSFGFWLATKPRLRWVIPLGLASLVYLVVSRLVGWNPPFLPNWGQDNLLGAGYALLLVALGLRYLPARIPAFVSSIGRSTYHIFLFQIFLFAVIDVFPMSWRWVIGLPVPLFVGVLWARLEAPLLKRLTERRSAAVPSPH